MEEVKQWYEREDSYKKRLLREIDFVKEYKKSTPKSKITYSFWGKSENLLISYSYEYKNKIFGIICLYPVLYPKVRIEVSIFEYDKKLSEVLPFQGGYHNTMGTICLFNHYPNEWNEDYGIKVIMKRVEEWFEKGQYDKRNNVPINYNLDNELFIFSEPLLSGIREGYGTFEFINIKDKICVVQSISIGNKTEIVRKLPESLKNEEGMNGKGIIIVTHRPIVSSTPNEYSDIKVYLNCFKQGVKGLIKFATANNIDFPIPIVIIYKNENCQGHSFLLLKNDKRFSIQACRFSNFRVYEDIFSRIKDRDDLNYLRRKKVALIGLGAIGSLLAVELSRSGVERFVLIDYEKLEIQNIGRHDLTLRDIDKYKVQGVKNKILDINPNIKCEIYNSNVLNDSSSNLYNILDCDLIISTIDDQEAKYAIDSTLIPRGKKVIYSGAFYNSIAGFVLVSDKKMACFKCLSQIMDYMADNKEIPNFSALVPENTEYDCGIPTFPGGSINTHTISILAARISIETLLGRREINEQGYPYNLYIIGNEKMYVEKKLFFQGYMDIKRYALPGIETCKVCDEEIALTEEETEKYNEIMKRLRK
ncbi:ThiF family adenylyltransferase [Clostridium sartagoforme]|uniref:ThiF family adenylyltransferase n=1 Tax=Clostridium sartagoforme TaxID=84031 RepID=UPI0031E3B902